MLLHSFAELARVYKCPVKAKRIMSLAPYVEVEHSLGVKAAVLWGLMQDRESRGVYGNKGAIIASPEMLAEESGYSVQLVAGQLVSLVMGGWLGVTSDGKAVKTV